MEPDDVSLCEWCDQIIDPSDVDVEAFETFGGLVCRECMSTWGEDPVDIVPTVPAQNPPGPGSLKTHRRRARRQRAQERAVTP
jgi:hypothetical protein